MEKKYFLFPVVLIILENVNGVPLYNCAFNAMVLPPTLISYNRTLEPAGVLVAVNVSSKLLLIQAGEAVVIFPVGRKAGVIVRVITLLVSVGEDMQ